MRGSYGPKNAGIFWRLREGRNLEEGDKQNDEEDGGAEGYEEEDEQTGGHEGHTPSPPPTTVVDQGI